MSAALQMQLMSSGSAPGQINQNSVTLIVRKSQWCAFISVE